MAATMFAFSAFVMVEEPTWALVSMLAFIFIFQNTSGAVTWLYCSEIAVDTSLGFVGTVGYFTTFCVSLSTQPLIDSSLGLEGTFMLWGVLNIVSTIWCTAFLKETSGLTDI